MINYLSARGSGEIKSADEFPEDWYSYVKEDHFWIAWRYRAFLNLLCSLSVDTDKELLVLDIGCGNGITGRQLERDTVWTVDGSDLNESALADAGLGRGEILFYDIHDRLPEYRNRYDMVILFDVLEHIDDDVAFLKSVHFHLKPEGLMFINVPARKELRSRYDELVGHVRRYDRPALWRELLEADFEPVDLRYWGFTNVPLLLLRKLLFHLRPLNTADTVRTGFKPPSAMMNKVFHLISRIETKAFKRPPIGSSIIGAARKR